jgi:PIN domain nuclease of toxin-antitoxin system
VNWAEASVKLRDYGMTPRIVRHALAAVDAEIASFAESDADAVAELTPRTRSNGLSLGARACIALALTTGASALTAERAWSDLDLAGLALEQIR